MLKIIWDWVKKRVSSLWEKMGKDLLLSFLIGTFVLLSALVLAVMSSESVEGCVSQLLGVQDTEGVSKKYGVLKALVIVMGGVVLVMQAWIANKRAKAMENAANEQAKANQNTEQGQRQERLKNAIEHLGHDNASVRLGGAYELFHLVEDTKDLRQTILDILCAHIRRTTGEDEYRKKHPSKPSEEVQSLLTLLFVQKHEVFKGFHINLQGSWLNGANLHGAHLRRAFLDGTYLRRAILGRAYLQGTNFIGAHLQEAILGSAYMQGSILIGANLQSAILGLAHMQGSILEVTELQKANLTGTELQGIARFNAEKAEKDGVSLQFAERMRASIGQESDLSGAIGIGPNSGAITGAYTAEEAEQWIAEYNEAMSEVPEESAN